MAVSRFPTSRSTIPSGCRICGSIGWQPRSRGSGFRASNSEGTTRNGGSMKLMKYRNYGRLWRVHAYSALHYATPRKVRNAVHTELAYRRRESNVHSAPYVLFVEPHY